MRDLQSSLKKKGKYVTQIIHFKGGIKRTFEWIYKELKESNEKLKNPEK